MLLPRVLSAFVMVAVFACAIFALKETGFMLFMGVVVLFAGWEWARLSGVKALASRLMFAILVDVLCVFTYQQSAQQYILYIAPLLWLLALYWVISYPTLRVWRHPVGRLIHKQSRRM